MGEELKRTEVFTYEKLFEILRAEKNSPNLQKLDKNTPEHIAQYLTEKEQQLITSFKSDNIFAADDVDNLQIQLRNARRIVRMIYDLREKKIIQMALNKSRTSSSIIDTSSLQEYEIALFKEVLDVLDRHRHARLIPLVDPKRMPLSVPELTESFDVPQQEQPSTKMLVRFLEEVPVLVGPDLKEYGPYYPEDLANIPAEIGKALVDSRKAQEIKPA